MRVADLPLAWRTDFILHRFDGQVREEADALIVTTPSAPTFYWGNFVLMPAPPSDADITTWCARFEREVAAGRPEVQHVALGYLGDAPPGPAWAQAGFEYIVTVALAAQRHQVDWSPLAVPGECREIVSEADHAAALDLQSLDCWGFEPEGYRRFRAAQMARIRRMKAQGQAAWFGWWRGDALLANCGLIWAPGDSVVRFQYVLTHRDHRRQGVARALVQAVSRYAFEVLGPQQAVICADPSEVAIHLYQSLGYVPVDRAHMLQRRAPQDRP